jgi:hypothetical protein
MTFMTLTKHLRQELGSPVCFKLFRLRSKAGRINKLHNFVKSYLCSCIYVFTTTALIIVVVNFNNTWLKQYL